MHVGTCTAQSVPRENIKDPLPLGLSRTCHTGANVALASIVSCTYMLP